MQNNNLKLLKTHLGVQLPSRKNIFSWQFSILPRPAVRVAVLLGIFALSIWFVPVVAKAATVGKPANYLLQSGLVGWWTFDGADMVPNVRDRSGSGNHGNLIGQTSTTTAPGKIGQAMSFDGVDDYINAGASDNLNITTSPFSISSWVYRTGSGNLKTIVDKTRGSSGNGSYYFSVTTLDKMQFFLGDGSVPSPTFTTTASLPADRWVYVVGVWDGTTSLGSIKVYFDGVSQAGSEGNYGTTMPGNALPALIGAYNTTAGSGNWTGKIDDVRIYNRALSATEIKSLYSSGSAKVSSTPRGTPNEALNNGLVGHWTFDGSDMGPNVLDRSGQGNHGNLLGQTSTTTVVGKIGQALRFDGVNDSVLVNDNSSLEVTNQATWSFWGRQFTEKNGAGIINKMDSPFSYLVRANTGAEVGIQTSNDGVAFETDSSAQDCGFRDDSWTFITITLDSGSIVYYRNGVQCDTDTTAMVTLNDSSNNITFGRSNGYAYFDGSLDDIRIYNRALSASEISDLYNQGVSKFAVTPKNIMGEGLNNGLVGHWTFDGSDMNPNVLDRSGSGNHGNLIGQTSTTTAIGKLGQALSFDGVNDYINCGSDPSVLPDAFSFSAWVKTNSTAVQSTVFGLGNNTVPYFILQGSLNRPLLYLASSNYRYWSATTPTNLINSDWHHYVVVLPGNSVGDIDNAVLYIDGRVQDVNLTTNSDPQGSKSLCKLGGFHTAGTLSPLNGVMDEARLYNRVLSASEVTQLYNLGR